MAAAFHPELTADHRLHAAFVELSSVHDHAGGVSMSGHSKWATIKHKKGAADKARGKLFNKLPARSRCRPRAAAATPTPTRRCAPRCRRPRPPR